MLRRILVPLTAATMVALPATQASAKSTAPATTRAQVVKVTAGSPSEFRFTLSKKTVKRGAVVFKITNKGTLPHDFKIHGKKTPLIQPRKSRTLRVTFKKVGKYKYLCTVSGHAAAGMKGVLRVK
jgi:uncharacterized cupredoxin-like copper-binding protein